jgi:hypothetical protein
LDGAMERTKVNIYEDGSDEEYLKMIKEFLNYLEKFEMWEKENAARILCQNFRRCISGATKDLWDQINTIEENKDRDELNFNEHLAILTKAVIRVDAADKQKEIFKRHSQTKEDVRQAMGESYQKHLQLMDQDT